MVDVVKVLDLFSGLEGWSAPFQAAGHDVITLDMDPRFGADMQVDILTVDAGSFPWRPDIILASPPCEGFSVMTIGRNWHYDGRPKTAKAALSLRIVEKTLDLIEQLKPAFFIIENPRAKLRKLPIMQDYDRRTVTYCQYGEARMKPTDLWGGFPKSLILDPPCRNGDLCHVRAVRGSRTGTQGMNRYESAKIPYPLADDVRRAAERDL